MGVPFGGDRTTNMKNTTKKEVKQKIEKNRVYSVTDAVTLLTELRKPKFDETVEVHLHLGIDPKKGEQQLRGTVSLPHGTGKTKKVIAFVEADKEADAKAAGADIIGDQQKIEEIAVKKVIDFDVAVATPSMMPKLAKIAQILGPKGLMPNPKTDTVGPNIVKIITEQKAGKISFKNDDTANTHLAIGKLSFGKDKLIENLVSCMDAIRRAKPGSVKGIYILSASLKTTMSPAIRFTPEA